MKKLSLAFGGLLLLGAGCSSAADINNIETEDYRLSVPDSVTTTQIENGYRVQNFDAADVETNTLAANAYYVDFLQDGTTVEDFTTIYPDATESTLGLNDGEVWMATSYDTGDGIWAEDVYFHPESGTLIVEHYTQADGEGIVLAELLVNAITWK